jgi:serine/threonine protein kinase
MGVVYRARHKLLRREVALKIILGSGGDSEVISRFREEARSVATLKHPGIVQIHEYSEHHGIPWFSLELVNGKTLAQLIATEPMDPMRAARIMADVASAVGYAHDRGVLHRDIKPANVLIAEGDIAKLTDFGLAKQVTSEKEASNEKTIEGQIMGTPGFMSPEQARGIVGELGPFSDQYSLGATLYCLLTGRAPFIGTPIDVVVQVINNDPLTVRQLQPSTPLDLETICLKAMSKEPTHRYPDCAAFEADLRRFLGNEPIHARPIGNVERIIRWCRRNPKVAVPAMTTVLSVLTALGISLWSAVTLSAKNTAIRKQNQEITQQNQEITIQRGKFETAKDLAEASAIKARENEQKAFFRLLIEAKDDEEILIISTGSQSISGLALRSDIASRLSSGLNFELHTLQDDEKIKAVQDFASAKGLNFSEDIAPWLLDNFHRDMPSLISLVEALDQYSLQTKRSITLPLVRDLLKNKT